MTVQIGVVSSETLDIIWPKVVSHIAAAIARTDGRFTLDGTLGRIRDGRWLLFIAFDETGKVLGSVTIEVLKYDAFNVAWVGFIGGEQIHLWQDKMEGALEEFAKINDCKVIEGSGRFGWEKFLSKYGHGKRDLVVSKRLGAN